MPSVPDLVHNERVKLTASWLNTMGAASIALGVFTPIAVLVTTVERSAPVEWGLLWGAAAWFPAGVSLHLAGRFFLGRLRP